MKPATMTLAGLLVLLFGCDRKGGAYEKRDDGWSFNDQSMDVAAGRTVVPLANDFATVDGDAYYRAAKIDGADGASFQVLGAHYAKDRKAVYYADTHRDGQEYFLVKHTRVRPIEGADAASFRNLDHGYGRDAANVYFEGKRIAVSDPGSFEPLGYGHARDRVRGYYMQRPIAGSDGSTFAALTDHYSKDAAHAYYSDIDPRTNPGRVVPHSTPVPGAHAPSFAALDDGYAADSVHAYYKGAVLRDAVPPLEVLEVGYARTAKRVYYFGELVPDADAATFASQAMRGGGVDAMDARGSFYEGRRAR